MKVAPYTANDVSDGAPDARVHVLRRRVAPLAGLALLLSAGALAVRLTAMTLLSEQPGPMWFYTAAACALAGVALVAVALPAIAQGDEEEGRATRRRTPETAPDPTRAPAPFGS